MDVHEKYKLTDFYWYLRNLIVFLVFTRTCTLSDVPKTDNKITYIMFGLRNNEQLTCGEQREPIHRKEVYLIVRYSEFGIRDQF